jgi:hypothetical protein
VVTHAAVARLTRHVSGASGRAVGATTRAVGTIVRVAGALAVCLCSAQPRTLAGQTAPAFLEPGHWSYEALRRLSGAGVTPPGVDPAAAPVSRSHAGAVFAAAADSALVLGRADLARLAAGYGQLLRQEADSAGALAGLELGAGWRGASGEALAGDGYYLDEDWQGARTLPSWRGPSGELSAHGYPVHWLAWTFQLRGTVEDVVVPAASVAAAFGPFDLWAGRRRLHYGSGSGGGTVLGSGLGGVPDHAFRTEALFDGVGLHVREPFRLPWWFDVLGPVRIEVAGGQLAASGRVASPWVVFGRLTTTPFTDRWLLGVNRGAIFGGDDNPVTAGRLLGLLIGLHGGDAGEFENQVFSVVSRFRPPLGPVALELHAEVGMDDTSGAISAMPGIIAGVDLASVPGATALALGLEHAQFPGSCCGNPIWYRSIFFRGSWADEGRLFAHPLGGHGREWRARGRLDLPGAGVLLRGEAFVRNRGHENLFAPERAGRSHGGGIGLNLRPGWAAHRGAGLRLNIDADIERSTGRDTGRLSAILSYTFRAENP